MTPTLAEPGFANLLHQADHWATRDDAGRLIRVRLDDMGPDHRRRVLAWCREHAEFLHTRELDCITTRYKRGHLSDAEFAADVAQVEGVTAAVWLDDTALVRRLAQLTPAQPAPPRRRRLLPWRLR